MASNLDRGFDYESGIAAGMVAEGAVVRANAARCAGSTAPVGPRRGSATHIDLTTPLADGCRTAP